MSDERLPKRLLYDELQEGKRTLLRSFSIDLEDWETTANDHNEWRWLTVKGADQFEADRIAVTEHKHRLRKSNKRLFIFV